MARLTNESLMRLKRLQEENYTIRYITLENPPKRDEPSCVAANVRIHGRSTESGEDSSRRFSVKDMQRAAMAANRSAGAAKQSIEQNNVISNGFRYGIPAGQRKAQMIAACCAEHKIARRTDAQKVAERREESAQYSKYESEQILAEKRIQEYEHPEKARATVMPVVYDERREAPMQYKDNGTTGARQPIRSAGAAQAHRSEEGRQRQSGQQTYTQNERRSMYQSSTERVEAKVSSDEASTASKTHSSSMLRSAYEVGRNARELQQAISNGENNGGNSGAAAVETLGKQASRSAMRRAGRAAGKAAVSLGKGIKRVIVNLIRSAVAAVGSSKALLVAGIIFCVLAVGMVVTTVLCSPFGILYTDENKDNPTLASLIVENELRYKAKLDALYRRHAPDIVEMTCNGGNCGKRNNNWPDIMGIWSVKSSMKLDMDVMELKPPKVKLLEEIFDDMVKIDDWIEYRRQIEVVGSTEDGRPITKVKIIKVLHIKVTEYKYREMYDPYDFDRDERNTTEELFADQSFVELVNELAASACCCSCCPGSSCAINVPGELPISAIGNDAVNLAAQYLGVPYDKMDCSQLSGAVYRALGVNLPRTAAAQANYCNDNGWGVSADNLQAGDLIFYSLKGDNGRYMDISHVAVYAGNGKMIDASSIYGEIVYRDVFNTTPTMYARPQKS